MATPQWTRKIEGRLQSGANTAQKWENDKDLLLIARSLIPLETLVSKSSPYSRPDDVKYMHKTDTDALLLKHLTLWFKRDFMQWVNSPKCHFCNTADNVSGQGVVPAETAEEREGDASRVELYQCSTCGSNLRFPRYNSCAKLMETRQGRCGEFANLFGFMCRAVGFETRYVLDFTDHVWVEVYSHRLDRWIMADSCEGKIDEPCMYEKGWGKKLNCIVAFTTESCVDVTRRYTRMFNSDQFQARRRECVGLGVGVGSAELQVIVDRVDATMRMTSNCSAARVTELDRRKKIEMAFLARSQQEPWEEDGLSEGRISGSLAWKISRGEAGDLNRTSQKQSSSGGGGVTAEDEVIVDAFVPNRRCGRLNIAVTSFNSTTLDKSSLPFHDAVSVAKVPCALGKKGLNVVIIDEMSGCVLQRGVFSTMKAFSDFVNKLPDNRIVAASLIHDFQTAGTGLSVISTRLPDFPSCENVALYVGQVGASPGWLTSIGGPSISCNKKVSISVNVSLASKTNGVALSLEHSKDTFPCSVSARVPESIMPVGTQVIASDEQKHQAATSALNEMGTQYVGYCTKPGHPIYLLTHECFPLNGFDECGWKTCHYVPEPLVSEVEDTVSMAYPVNTHVLEDLLGPKLVGKNGLVSTADAIEDRRLIGLYFSAHWCPPCRGFTPLLCEFYEQHNEEEPLDLQIIFLSSDRDPASFSKYFGSMPWLALPFEDRMRKEAISSKFGIRGIPGLVILDSISGQVVSQPRARQEVSQCRGDTKRVIANWLSNLPADSVELVEMCKMSYKESQAQNDEGAKADSDNEFLVRQDTITPEKHAKSVDPATRIKEIFTELVSTGENPTAAAAEAIQVFADEQASANETPKFGKGLDGPWSKHSFLGCVVCPTLDEYKHDQLYSFSDTIRPFQKLKGIRLHLHDNSSRKVVGVQSIYEGDCDGIIHLHPSIERKGGEIHVDCGGVDCNAHFMKVFMGKDGLTNVILSSTKHGEEQHNPYEFYLNVAEGSSIVGIHGIAAENGIVGLGLICTSGATETKSSTGSEIEVHAEKFTKVNDSAALTGVLTTAKKYLDNAAKEPFTPKFRSVRLGNKIFGRIVASPGGLDLLTSIGLAVYTNSEDFFVSIPLGLDLARAQKLVSDMMA